MTVFGRLVSLSFLAVLSFQTAASAEPFSPRVDDLIDKMTTEEKLGQLVQAAGGRSKSLNSRLSPSELDRVRNGEVGSYLHVAGAAPLLELQRVAVEESRLGIPLLFAMDVVHGYRTIFPVPLAMAATWEPDTWEQAARISAEEASAAGLHWTFAPMVDIGRDPRWGRVVEGAGSDPYFGARMAEAQVIGFQGTDLSDPTTIMAATKHFGAYGAAEGGRDYGAADISQRTLHEVYLPPFEAAARAGSGSFMTAFNDVAGVPTTGNEALVDGILRDQWDWSGMIVSDWNAIAELMNHGVAASRAAAGALALKAGVDMDMTSGIFGEDLADALAEDPSLMADLDLAVGHILTAKERLGLFDDPYAYHITAREEAEFLADDHRAAARGAAADASVLLKNEGGLLPLSVEAGDRVAVIGALADDAMTQLGSWRAQGQAEDVITLIDGIRAGVPEGTRVDYVPGADTSVVLNLRAAKRAARRADHVILVIGEDFDLSGEARSRSSVELPEPQRLLAEAVLESGKPVTVVLVTGRPMALPMLAEEAEAILLTWMMGVEAGPALADLLFGAESPAGRLPMSFPRATGQAPITYDRLPTGRPQDEDLTRDTNRYIDLPITPLWPFGHGLSYSEFSYSDLSITPANPGPSDEVSISVTVANTGDVDADEVVQLYLRDPVASVSRPVMQLRGFERVMIPAGDSRTITFTVSPAQMALWTEGGWVVEAGAIEVMVGASSADIRAQGSFAVTVAGQARVSAASIATKTDVQ